MIECSLSRKRRISRRASHELIQLMAKQGNHNFAFSTDASVKNFFKHRGYDYDKLVESIRNYPEPVPLVENFMPATGFASPGLQVSRVDLLGNEDLQLSGPGAFTMFGYQSQIEQTFENIEAAITNSSPQHLLTACMNGVASIEGYINYRAEIWNKLHPESPLQDAKQAPVSFSDKIDSWIPIMTSQKKLDKSGKTWNDFKRLKAIRDDIAVHAKSSGHAFSLGQLAELANCFSAGIAGLLNQLHVLFGERTPSTVIRHMYAPEVEVVETDLPQEQGQQVHGADRP